jgi:hypothetical protein
VVVAARTIAARTPIVIDDLTVREVALDPAITQGSFNTPDTIVGRTSGVPILIGQVITNNDNFCSTLTQDNIVRHLLTAGKTFKAYAESLPQAGYTGCVSYPYVKRHNPLAYFSDVANSSQKYNVVPFSKFATDRINNTLPQFSFIVPNLLHDAHDAIEDFLAVRAADQALRDLAADFLPFFRLVEVERFHAALEQLVVNLDVGLAVLLAVRGELLGHELGIDEERLRFDGASHQHAAVASDSGRCGINA